MISSMSQLGTYIPQDVLHKKDIKKMQKVICKEIKEEIELKKKEEIRHNLFE